jgi:hypothetical protein
MTLVSLICIRISHFLITNEAQPSLWLLPLLGMGAAYESLRFVCPLPNPPPRLPTQGRES